MEFVDLGYIQEKILQLEKNPLALKKFFSGKIVEEIVNLLVEQDAKEDPEKEPSAEYQRKRKCFSIVKTVILGKDFPRLFPILSRLSKCRIIFWDVINDIEKFKEKVPEECVDELSKNILEEIPNVENLEDKAQILHIIDYISSKHKIENSEIFNPLKDILNSLFTAVEKEKESFDYGKDFLLKFGKRKMRKEIKTEIWNNLISIIEPLRKIDKSKWIIEFCIDKSDELESQNKDTLLSRMNSQIYNIDVMSNEDASNFWLDNSKPVLDWYKEPQLDQLIKDPGDETNILRLSETRIDIVTKTKIARIITMAFDKISPDKQQVYLNILHQYLQDGNKDNYQFAIKNIHAIKDSLKNRDFIKSLLPDLSAKLDGELDDEVRIKNIDVQFSFKDFLDQAQKDKVIANVINLFPSQGQFCYDFVHKNWVDLSNLQKVQSIKAMLKTEIKDDITKNEEIVAKISSDFTKLGDAEKANLLDEYATKISDDVDNINFFIALIGKLKKHFDNKLRDTIRNKYIETIKKEEQLNISRNRFSVICSFKTRSFEKDDEVFSLFSNLLSASGDKIRLAIDNLIPYYKNRPPYRKKTVLTTLLEGASKKVDSAYRKKIRKISNKLRLQMRRSIFNLFKFPKV